MKIRTSGIIGLLSLALLSSFAAKHHPITPKPQAFEFVVISKEIETYNKKYNPLDKKQHQLILRRGDKTDIKKVPYSVYTHASIGQKAKLNAYGQVELLNKKGLLSDAMIIKKNSHGKRHELHVLSLTTQLPQQKPYVLTVDESTYERLAVGKYARIVIHGEQAEFLRSR